MDDFGRNNDEKKNITTYIPHYVLIFHRPPWTRLQILGESKSRESKCKNMIMIIIHYHYNDHDHHLLSWSWSSWSSLEGQWWDVCQFQLHHPRLLPECRLKEILSINHFADHEHDHNHLEAANLNKKLPIYNQSALNWFLI